MNWRQTASKASTETKEIQHLLQDSHPLHFSTFVMVLGLVSNFLFYFEYFLMISCLVLPTRLEFFSCFSVISPLCLPNFCCTLPLFCYPTVFPCTSLYLFFRPCLFRILDHLPLQPNKPCVHGCTNSPFSIGIWFPIPCGLLAKLKLQIGPHWPSVHTFCGRNL